MSAVHIIFFLAIQFGLSLQENRLSLPPSGCICPGSQLTFICTIEGGGITVWRGSFINNCIGRPESESDILLLHDAGFPRLHQICNNGAVTATALSVHNNTYTSQLSINMTVISLLNGSTVTCAHDDYSNPGAEIIDTWTMIDPPANLHLEDANRTHLNFDWNSVYPSCPSLHYNVRTTNCGTCSMNSDSTTVLCDNFNVSADIQVCSIAIQRRCGDNIIGNMSDILHVILKVPEAPLFAHKPSYYWIKNENNLMLNVTLNKTVAFKVSGSIDGSANSYTIEYSDSTSSTGCNDSVTIPASLCRSSVCNHVFKIANSFCSPSDISVTAFATNVFGNGPYSSAGILRSDTSALQKIYHDIIIINALDGLGGVAALIVSIILAPLTIAAVYYCYSRRQPVSDKPYIIEFYVDDEPGSLAKALQIFAGFKISLYFVDTLPSIRGQDEKLRGFCVSYHCSSKTNKKVMRKLEKEFGKKNITDVIKDNDQISQIHVQFAVKDEYGKIAGVMKIFGDLYVSVVDLKSGECSNNERQFTIECMCSIRKKGILTETLKKHGAINLTIDSEAEVPLPPPADDIERTIVKIQSGNEIGAFHGVVKSLSEIQKFKENIYKLCHVNMSSEGIYLVCTYPKGQRKQLKDDIEGAIRDTVQLTSPPEQGLKSGNCTAFPKANLTQQSAGYTEAKERMNVSFVHHQILECNFKGCVYTSLEHHVTIIIPEGAVDESQKVNFEIGVALDGPFMFPENTQPISPILWLCLLEENVKLKKPFKVILPHYLNRISKEQMQCHEIGFVKASHDTNTISYNFYCCSFKPGFFRNYGILESQHFCFYCLQAKKTPELIRDSGYCLARIESLNSPQRNEVYFSITYFLETCLESLKEQFPQEDGYRIIHCDIKFQNREEPYIKVVVPQEHDKCLIVMEPMQAMIKNNDINFWGRGVDHMQLRHEKKMYPPRVKMTVCMKNSHEVFKLPVKFEGCSKDSQVDLELTFPLSDSNTPVVHKSFSTKSSSMPSEKPDLKKAFKQLLPISSEWKTIGILLGLPSSSLKRIEIEEQDTNCCLLAMLSEWLKQVDPHPCWAQLIEAVEPLDAAKAAVLRTPEPIITV